MGVFVSPFSGIHSTITHASITRRSLCDQTSIANLA